ncbi:hypothetical protein WMY93_008089 [Mugilogobius chulae]|uniref:Uncharacterized protein n=1 Tax=Mugilogobius chulae TaxID=88201 RepID=A0AAW0PLH0_9GOBI
MAYGMDFTVPEVNAFYWSNTCLDLSTIEDYTHIPNRVPSNASFMRPDPHRRRKRTTFSKEQLADWKRPSPLRNIQI